MSYESALRLVLMMYLNLYCSSVIIASVINFLRRIAINEIRQISRKKLDFAKLTEARSEIL